MGLDFKDLVELSLEIRRRRVWGARGIASNSGCEDLCPVLR
jgi:hypothetical protein